MADKLFDKLTEPVPLNRNITNFGPMVNAPLNALSDIGGSVFSGLTPLIEPRQFFNTVGAIPTAPFMKSSRNILKNSARSFERQPNENMADYLGRLEGSAIEAGAPLMLGAKLPTEIQPIQEGEFFNTPEEGFDILDKLNEPKSFGYQWPEQKPQPWEQEELDLEKPAFMRDLKATNKLQGNPSVNFEPKRPIGSIVPSPVSSEMGRQQVMRYVDEMLPNNLSIQKGYGYDAPESPDFSAYKTSTHPSSNAGIRSIVNRVDQKLSPMGSDLTPYPSLEEELGTSPKILPFPKLPIRGK